MKKYILSLVALFVTMSINAQVVKVYDTESATPTTPVATYTNGSGHKYKVVFEEASTPAPGTNLLTGKFSVSATKKVQFAKGNLQATYSTSTSSYTWGFAANQWDYIGGKNSSGVGTETGNNTIDSQTDGAVVDLFGWSTDATNNNWGIHTQTSTSYAYTGGNFEDWGGLFPGKGYFTLSKDEWEYLLNKENATSGARTQTNRYAKAMVNSVQGLLIFPDNYNGTITVTDIDGIATVNSITASYPTSSIPAETWTMMESAGVVFLPAARSRNGSSVGSAGSVAYYWSSTTGASQGAFSVFLGPTIVNLSSYFRYSGLSVRLVKSIVNVTSLTLNKTSTSISVGSNETLTANIAPDNATYKNVIWTSSDESKATVDATGKVTGVAAGTATITAKSADGAINATCAVTITDANLLPGEFTVAEGKTVKFTKGNLYYSSTDSKYHFESAQNVTYATLGQTEYDATHVCLFYWSNTDDWQTSGKEPWAKDYSYSAQDTGDKFFCGVDNKMTVDGTSDLYALSGGEGGEWDYLINTRANASSLHKYKVSVTTSAGTVDNCLIIAPDGYDYTNPLKESYTADEWAAAEALGLVCLPAAGYRLGSGLDLAGSYSCYWSSTPYAFYADGAHYLGFGSDFVDPANFDYRTLGCSLRLVK